MLKDILKAFTPPVVWTGLRQIKSACSAAPELFDGHGDMFKNILKTTKVYGEYGCGASTKWVMSHTDTQIIAVDTSKEWIEDVKKATGEPERLNLIHVDLGDLAQWGRPVSYSRRDDFTNYTNAVWQQGIKPDTVLIDGRFRVSAFLTSLKEANQGTHIIFDDYMNRPYYHAVEEFIRPDDICGRQALFVVPEQSNLDLEKLNYEINAFRYVMD